MTTLMAVIDGTPTPLADCDWVRWAPCGCPRGVMLAVSGGDVVAATPEQAHAEFTPRKRDRDRETRNGYRITLVTHQHWCAEISDLLLEPCPHKKDKEEAS